MKPFIQTSRALIIALLCLSFQTAFAQFIFSGKVMEGPDPVVGASVIAYQNNQFVRGCSTNIHGEYRLSLDTGTYKITISYTGFQTITKEKWVIYSDLDNVLDVSMQPDNSLSEVVVTAYAISKDKISKTGKPRPGRSHKVADQLRKKTEGPGITSAGAAYMASPSATSANIKGSRANSTNYYVDGIRVSGNAPPVQDMEQLQALTRQSAQNMPDVKEQPKPAGDTIIDDINTTQFDQITENPFQEVKTNSISTFSIDVDAASYATIRSYLNADQLPPRDAVRIEEMINYFDYDYPGPKNGQPFAVQTEVAPCPWNAANRLLRIGIQGEKIDVGQLPPANLVFLIDVSGSMNEENKLPLVIKSLEMLTDQLRPNDHVAIAVYAGAAGLVLESTPGSEKMKIKAALDALQAGGSTAGGAGIKLAYETARKNFIASGNNRVILCTDGDFNVGVSSEQELNSLIEEERKSGVYLTVLGFGMGNYQDGKMQSLADKGNGNHAYIDQLSEAKKVLTQEFGGTLFTIAKDVKLQLHFNPEHVAGYRLIGYENRMLATEDFNDDTKDAGELGAGHRVTALYELIPSGQPLPALTRADSSMLASVKADTTVQVASEDLIVLQMRYKKPKGEQPSQLLEFRLNAAAMNEKSETDAMMLSSAIAEFGLLLRQSKYKAKASYAQAIERAQAAATHTPNGYRKELVNLMGKAQSIAEPAGAMKK